MKQNKGNTEFRAPNTQEPATAVPRAGTPLLHARPRGSLLPLVSSVNRSLSPRGSRDARPRRPPWRLVRVGASLRRCRSPPSVSSSPSLSPPPPLGTCPNCWLSCRGCLKTTNQRRKYVFVLIYVVFSTSSRLQKRLGVPRKRDARALRGSASYCALAVRRGCARGMRGDPALWACVVVVRGGVHGGRAR